MTAPHRIAGLVLAAGAGRRFGGPKQLAELDGRPLLEHALAAIAAVPALERVAVTLGAHDEAIRARVDLHGAQPIVVTDWAEGQAASLRAGVAALAPVADAVVVTLADQPRLTTSTIAGVVAAWDGRAAAVRAVHDGSPGHPVLLARQLYPAVARLRGDEGARRLLVASRTITVQCGPEVVLDIDERAQIVP